MTYSLTSRFFALSCISIVGQCFAPLAVLANDGWPDVAAPPRSNVFWVADDMVQNGVPMQVQGFNSQASASDVVAFYRAQWSGKTEFKPVENAVSDWSVIGYQSGDFYVTVQAKSSRAGGSEGFIAVSRPDSAARVDTSPIQGWGHLPRTETLSDTRSNDLGKRTATVLLSNDYPVHDNARFYETELRRRGFAILQNYTHKGSPAAKILYSEKQGQSCQITIGPLPDRRGSLIAVVLAQVEGN